MLHAARPLCPWLISDVSQRMKKRIWIFIGVLIAVVAARWCWAVRSDAGYISQISGVHIPLAAWPVNSYELDWCIVVKYRVSKATAQTIASEHSFVPLATFSKEGSLELDSLAAKFEGRRSAFDNRSGLVGIRGRTKTNKWELVTDTGSGLLWAVVMFPDMAGHFPSQ
jgi:hypothetical protein